MGIARGRFIREVLTDAQERTLLLVWCPGCDDKHPFWVRARGSEKPAEDQHTWGFDWNLEAPTFTPSLLVHSHKTLINHDLVGDALTAPENVRETPQCHSFVREGRWQFLGDCTHGLAGKTYPMVPLPAWLVD